MSDRRPRPDPNWWTCSIEAYLDLRYRWLPAYVRALHRDQSRRRTLSLWQVGYEDGSESLLLAAIVDEVLGSLAATARPDLAGFASRLGATIRATDTTASLQRSGRTLRFEVSGGPRSPKFPVVPEDRGPEAGRRWAIDVEMLEADAAAHYTRERLRRLGDAGKVALLFSSWLRRSPRGGGRYRIINDTWRLDDPEHGPPLNPTAAERRIHFETEDVTTGAPRAKHDLVLCANVLPHLPLYHGQPRRDLAELRRVCTRLARAVRPGGALVVDAGTGRVETWGRPFAEEIRTMARRLGDRGSSLLALDPGGLRRVRAR